MHTHTNQSGDHNGRRGDLEPCIERIRAELALSDEDLHDLVDLLARFTLNKAVGADTATWILDTPDPE